MSFSPTQAGLRAGSIKFPTNLGIISFGVYGQGTVPHIRLSNPPLLFSNQQVGTTSAPQTIIATNIGNGSCWTDAD